MTKTFHIEPLNVTGFGPGFGAVVTETGDFLPNWFANERQCREFMKARLMDCDWVEKKVRREAANSYNGISF